MGKTPTDPFAAAVRAHIDRRGMSVTELAGRADLDRSEISKWLNGDRSIGSAKLAKVLDAIDKLRSTIRHVSETK